MVRPLERKHQPLSVRLGILTLQSNIQIPTIDGVELYLKILEAEAIKLQADDVSKPKNAKADSEEYHIPNANQAAAGGKGGPRLCAYFNTARGCFEFRHETAGTGKGAKGSEKGGGKAGEPKGANLQQQQRQKLKQKPKQQQRRRQRQQRKQQSQQRQKPKRSARPRRTRKQPKLQRKQQRRRHHPQRPRQPPSLKMLFPFWLEHLQMRHRRIMSHELPWPIRTQNPRLTLRRRLRWSA